ncbi:MAG: helix-turn-helix domain-containing protein [Clostridia bacterium]|nr:helix-turn-helix domain-containing protein [Clostridia bacterium]
MNFGEKLTNLRKQKGLSQEELGEKLNVTRQTISKWELEQTSPDVNKLKEIAKLFETSLDELLSNTETTKFEKDYKESNVERKNKKISLKIFVCGLIVSIILCGIGLIKQNSAKKENKNKEQQALEQSQSKVDSAEKEWKEICSEIELLEPQVSNMEIEISNMRMELQQIHIQDRGFSDRYLSKNNEINVKQAEKEKLQSQLNNLYNQKFEIENKDYTVYYSPVKPITYLIFYYIAGGIFVLISLIALIYFLVTRK